MLRLSGFHASRNLGLSAALEIFPTMNDLIVRLSNSPIIPDFDLAKDKTHLEEVEKSCKTPRGIENPSSGNHCSPLEDLFPIVFHADYDPAVAKCAFERLFCSLIVGVFAVSIVVMN